MNELKIFNSPNFGEVRMLEENGAVLFCASDVAKALGYSNPRKAVADHCRCVTKRDAPHPQAPGKLLEMSFIPEGDVYRLIARSKLPDAEKFESWIFDEVLPSIRKTGGYIHGQETMSDDELMSKALLVAQRTIAAREERINALEVNNAALAVSNQVMAPKADYFDELVDRNLLTNFRETAKELGVKQTDLVRFLLEKKYLYRDKKGKLMPRAGKSTDLFEVKECFNEKTQWSGTQTMVTPKGRETFRLLCQGLKG